MDFSTFLADKRLTSQTVMYNIATYYYQWTSQSSDQTVAFNRDFSAAELPNITAIAFLERNCDIVQKVFMYTYMHEISAVDINQYLMLAPDAFNYTPTINRMARKLTIAYMNYLMALYKM